MKNSELRVGIVGASGHAGGELCRLLLSHPNVAEILPSSRSKESFNQIHPNLYGCGLEFVDPDMLREQRHQLDVVFFCAPSGEAMSQVRPYLDAGAKVIDLGPDFRFSDASRYHSVYGHPHAAADLLKEAVYGATELYREQIRQSRLVANPGCYALACLLALAPPVQARLVDLGADINIFAVNGTTGASSTPSKSTHHAAVANGMLSYSMEGHRHGPELEEQLGRIAGAEPSVVISTSHGPFPRGIQAFVTARIAPSYGGQDARKALLDLYANTYGRGTGGERFVVVNNTEKAGAKNEKEYHLYPNVGRLVGSNYCHLGVDFDASHGVLKIVAAIDNLVKGAAGSAIQNMNVMFNIEESTGLRSYGL